MVPEGLQGLDRLAAKLILEGEGFSVLLQDEPSCLAESGFVAKINPPSGSVVTAIPPRVTLTISTGGVDDASAIPVPDVVNKKFSAADAEITQAGLKTISRTFTKEGLGFCPQPVGQPKLIDSVTKSAPAAGAKVCPGTSVVVVREIYQRWKETPKNEECP